MSKQEPLFKAPGLAFFLCLVFLGVTSLAYAQSSSSSYSERKASLYHDTFDQNAYYEGTQHLHLERLYRDLFGKEPRALDVNVFDEVPDSAFFTNRHAKESMSLEDLKRGPAVTEGPDFGGPWTITKGKFDGITPGFFIRDAKGGKYLLKFDPLDHPELASGAEVIAGLFLHALGYNVPQYTIVSFKKDQLAIDPQARIYDQSGFRRELTPQRLEEFLLFVPETAEGNYRASASKILQGQILGPMKLQGRRREDPDDTVNHEDRREIRALVVFSAWLNNYDVRESNTLDVVENQDGRSQIRHYFIDFNSSLGATPRGPKPPEFGHEHLVDYGEIFKGVVTFGLWKKPWQKRWDEAGREILNPSLGYFDNRQFNPARYKAQLPYFPFKDLTRADGFWAAKILMKFTNQEIEELVSTGEFSDEKTRKDLAQILIERRDLIARYWFGEANPLDEFQLFESGAGSYELRFQDLAVRYGFAPKGESVYRFEVIAKKGKKGKKGKRLAREEVHEEALSLRPEWLSQNSSVDLLIRTRKPGQKSWSPFVLVEIRSGGTRPQIATILHQD